MARTMAWCVGVAGLIALGCSGAGPGGDKGPKTPKPKMGDSPIEKGKRTKKPTKDDHASRVKKNEYVLKLRPGAGVPKFLEGKVRTKDSAIDSAFAKIDMEQAAKLMDFEPKNKELAAHLGFDRTLVFRSKQPPEKVVPRLEKHQDIEWVEPVVEMRNTSLPNDPYYSYQWHMKMLDVPTAWETSEGEGVVVAVIDSGVSEGSDGYHKLLKGKDFVDGDTNPEDLNGHGTHVAGTIGQATNNGKGVAGVAPKVSILPVRVLDANGSGSNTWVAEGIIWAVDNGANIINMSLGGPTGSEVVEDACKYAIEQGVTVIAATGNDGFTDYIGYPAAYETTIAVGSIDAKKKIAFYSNQGKQIDLVAPGGDTGNDLTNDGMGDGVVQEANQNGEWQMYFLQGTSMATPHVSGVAALLYANGVTDPADIEAALTETADDLGGDGWDKSYGHGLVNPVAALAWEPKGGKKKGNGKLAIKDAKVRKISASRAVITWSTNKAATSMIRGTDGTKQKVEHAVTTHKVTVDGSKGDKVTYTIGSKAGEVRASTKVTHTF